ncbi:NAD(P)/FAD-dependent oxidoreductase [Candidatus Uhrbacteria bacterium]|nr:NAD(P)/FAD-dependent oxidoreductase [Candidatus Uhrbacteria bacterium]
MKRAEQIVIAGAGFAGIYAWKALRKRFGHDATKKIILVNHANFFLFTPLLHEVATGSLMPETLVEPLHKIIGQEGSELVVGDVLRVSLKTNTLDTTQGPVPFDRLLLALGSETNFYAIAGAQEHCFVLKTMEDATRLKNRFIDQFEKASQTQDLVVRESLLHFVVVGGGPTGVELAGEMSELFYESFGDYYPNEGFMELVRITLIQSSPDLLPMFSPAMRERSKKILEQKHVEILLDAAVTSVDERGVTMQAGARLKSQTIIWTAGVKPRSISFDEPVAHDARGAVVVSPFLQIPSHDHVFVLGDMARADDGHGGSLPPTAQVAVQEGEYVARVIAGETASPFRYHHKGSLVSLGQWMAIAELGRWHVAGRVMWWLWRTVYWSKLPSWQKKVRVAIDWTIELFSTARDTARL